MVLSENGPENDVLVLDGAKLKVLIKEYARDCVREEMKRALQSLLL